jgi:hypothetical protein
MISLDLQLKNCNFFIYKKLRDIFSLVVLIVDLAERC